MVLSDIAYYVEDKISSDEILLEDYITTDNILQNKMGRSIASNMPPTSCFLTHYMPGDVLVSNIRPYLRKIWLADCEGGCNADVLVFRPTVKGNNGYLYAVLMQDSFFDYVMKAPVGSKMPRGEKRHIMRYPVFQKISGVNSICHFLSNIDKKIAINRRINERLEGMAKLLYDYWFVQFEFPNEEGKPYKSSGGKMVWNEKLKREIPEGWEVKKIGDITKDDLEQIKPSDNPDKLYRHFSIPAYDTNHYYTLERGETILSDKYVLTQDDIIVSKLNPWVSRVIWGMDLENAICSTEFVSLTPINNGEKGFVYFCAKSLPFISYCTKASTGTSHSHRRVNPNIMRKYPIPYNHEVLSKFSSMVNPIAEMIMMNLENNYCLTEVRNYLLPMLMNGQVEIKEK